MFINKYKILRKFKLKNKKYGGRNNLGRITIRHRGGGSKNFYRILNWNHNNIQNGIVLGMSTSPKNKKNLVQLYDLNKKKISYISSPTKIGPLDNISNSIKKIQEGLIQYRYKISDLEIGDFIYNIQKPNSIAPQYVRSAGTTAQLIQKQTMILNYSLIQLPSGEHKLIHKNSLVSKGRLNNVSLKYETLKKAGRSRWLGKRSKVRGVAMNPIDHPHGGGQGKTSGGRPSVSPWGRLTKNVPTRKKRSNTSWTIIKKR